MTSPLVNVRLRQLSWLTTGVAFLVVGMGAFTRLVDAGLGCPDWPACYGSWVPRETAAGIELYKAWVEMLHRYVAALLGGLILVMTLWVWRSCAREGAGGLRWHAAGLLGLVVLQGAFGMWTVTLQLWPQVVALHLLGGFLTLGMLFLLSLRLGGRPAGNGRCRGKRTAQLLVGVGALLLLGQVGLGGWTSANYAALSCPDFPTCHARWWPEVDLSGGFDLYSPPGDNHLGGVRDGPARVAIHWVHRLGALTLSLYWLLLGAWLWQVRPRLRGACARIVGLLAVQAGLGVGNVLWQLPLVAALAHTLVAATLWLSALALWFLLLQDGAMEGRGYDGR